MLTEPTNNKPVLQVRNLQTYFYTDQGVARAVDDVSFDLYPGKTLALVGESGCGKSVTAMSLLRLIPEPPGRIVNGEVLFEDRDLTQLSLSEMRKIRGNDISMIFQEPMTSMNPVFKIGRQISAVLRLHQGLSKEAAWNRGAELLDKVGIVNPAQRMHDYPHQLSGGMLQRVMIAMALACDPKVLIADEPTTALDVTIQAQILELLNELQRDTGLAVLLITHDLGVVAEVADEVAVMYAGRIVEHAAVEPLFEHPRHPYTIGLFESLPSMHAHGEELHTIKGTVPAATHFPEGCRFHPRCPYADLVPKDQRPPLAEVAPNHQVACWLYDADVMQQQNLPTGIPDKAPQS